MPLRQPCYGFPCIVRDLACKQGWVGGGGGRCTIVKGVKVEQRCPFGPKK